MEHLLGWTGLLAAATLVVCTIRLYPWVKGPLIAAFSVRVLLALTHFYLIPLPDSQADALWFEKNAFEMSQGGIGTILMSFGTGAQLYSFIIALIYLVTDRSPLMIQAVNILFGTLIVLSVYRITLLLGAARKHAIAAAWAASLFPTLVLYSAITMREMIVVYFASLGIIQALKWHKKESTVHLMLSFTYFAISWAFHTAMLLFELILFAAVFGRVLYGIFYRNKIDLKYFVIALFLFLGIAGIVFSGWGMEKIYILNQGLIKSQQTAASGRAAYPAFLVPGKPLDLFWQAPLRIVYFITSPILKDIESRKDAVGILDALLYVLLFIIILKSYRIVIKSSNIRLLIFFISVGIIAFAIATSNYGTAIRHRAKFAPFLISVALAGISLRVETSTRRHKSSPIFSKSRAGPHRSI